MADVPDAAASSRLLHQHEKAWAARYEYLAAWGYILRPRYGPQWRPSWEVSGAPAILCEDGIIAPPNPSIMDAIKEDGTQVYIKRLHHRNNEKNITMMLSPEATSPCPQNHSVPVVALLHGPVIKDKRKFDIPPGDDRDTAYLVMPLLSRIGDVPFETVDQIVDFVEQLLEGLVYMHARGVAHRDCTTQNIMMDASALFPKGFHPVRRQLLPDGNGSAPRRARSSACVRYYFIDYGISTSFDPTVQQNRNVLGTDGIDRDVPELSATVPYDPFKVDIFLLGNLFKLEIFEKYKNTRFLEPLIHSMTAIDPAERPNAPEAYEHWTQLRKQLSSAQRAWRLKPRSEGTTAGVFLDAFTVMRLAISLPFKAVANTIFPRSPQEDLSNPPSTASRPSGTPLFPLSSKVVSLFLKRNKPTPAPQGGATASTADANCQSAPPAKHV